MEGEIERSLVYLEHVLQHLLDPLLDPLRDAPSVPHARRRSSFTVVAVLTLVRSDRIRLRPGPIYLPCTTLLLRVPTPEISISYVSPGSIARVLPIVPDQIRSPGSRVKYVET